MTIGYPHHPEGHDAVEKASPTDQLLADRRREYGEAWLLTGEVVDYLQKNADHTRLFASGFYYAWITILCKLIRVIRTPNHLDSWRDIIGYATLVVNHIEKHGEPK